MNRSSFNQGNALPHKKAENVLLQRMHHPVQPPKEKSNPFHGQSGPAPLPEGPGRETPPSRWALDATEEAVLPSN